MTTSTKQNRIPGGPANLVRQIPATKQQLRNAFSGQKHCVILDSSSESGELSRFSVFAANPETVFRIEGSAFRISGNVDKWNLPSGIEALDAIDFLLRTSVVDSKATESLPVCNGWFGYFGYDIAPMIERLDRRLPKLSKLPDAWLGYFDALAIYDESSSHCHMVVRTDNSNDLATATNKLDALTKSIQMASPGVMDDDGRPLTSNTPRSEFDETRYVEVVERIKEYIRAGDIFQANLSHRFEAPFWGNVEALFDRMVRLSPAPFSALIRTPEWSICSASPERFFHVGSDRKIETRPIKGTRPRDADPVRDRQLAAELLASAKDRAELTMIVDLERNDLGRVCEYGSVEVTRHAAIESFSNVHHLVSTVVGKLRPTATAAEILRALFPGGSITGAPKIRAMQIIDELETCRRGVYTGAIGYFDDAGRADFNIAIRTAVVEGGHVSFHSGGGIVADSDPASEFRETLAKASGWRRILGGL